MTSRTELYTGPFPRGRHSHRCRGCVQRGQVNSVACYKSKCTKPQTVDSCAWCNPSQIAKRPETLAVECEQFDRMPLPARIQGYPIKTK